MAKTKFEVPANFLRLKPKGKRKVWVNALRSGAFEQGTAQLTTVLRDKRGRRRSEQNCCLGVACELLVRAGVLKREIGEGHRMDTVYYDYVDEAKSQEVHDDYGLGLDTEFDDRLRELFGLDLSQQIILIGANDDGEDFNLIAKRIEEIK